MVSWVVNNFMEFYDMKIHTVKYSRCTGGNNGGAGAVQGSEA